MSSGLRSKMYEELKVRSIKIPDPAGRIVQILEDKYALKIAEKYRYSIHDVYPEALRLGIYPYRYLRNQEIISAQEQLKLAKSRVAVVGAGGLVARSFCCWRALG